MSILTRILATVALTVPAVGLRAADPAIIAKARAYLGSDAALDAVRTLHLTGHIVIQTPGKPDTDVDFDLVFEKPEEESLTAIFKDRFFRKVLDDYDGWMRVQPHQPGEPLVFNDRLSPSLTILGADEIRSLRADAWENLSFYRDIASVGGSVADLGPATVDGVACERVAFHHPGDIVYDRYFSLATGRLVYTVSNKGSQIRERGSTWVSGIRFPKTIVLTDRDAAGKVQTTTMTVNTVVVNQPFPESFFATPLPPLPQDAPPATATPAGGAATP